MHMDVHIMLCQFYSTKKRPLVTATVKALRQVSRFGGAKYILG